MDLGIRLQSIDRQAFGYIFSLITSEGYNIDIETEFTLNTANRYLRFSSESATAESEPLVALVGQSLASAIAEKDGTLELRFSQGDRLRVGPNPDYEAWTIAGPGGIEAVCMPGGELALWKAGNK